MACYKPLQAWRGRSGGPAVFVRPTAWPALEMQLPCGQCIGCRLERSRQWAVRIMHEASLHTFNSYLTLTYDGGSIPHSGSLVKSHFQDFMKRLRKSNSHRDDFDNLWHLPIRYFQCGEYGEKFARPHYHAILFGWDAPDKELFQTGESGSKLFTSKYLAEVWGHGFVTLGDVTFESAAYVARYITKKVTGEAADEHYLRFNSDGSAYQVEPEYITMSRRPGIGADWFDVYSSEVFPSDEVIVRGHPSKPPRYYDNLQAIAEPSVFDGIKRKRLDSARSRALDNTPERLRDREICVTARMGRFKRAYESGSDSE